MDMDNIQNEPATDFSNEAPLELGHHASEAFQQQAVEATKSVETEVSGDDLYDAGTQESVSEPIRNTEANDEISNIDEYGNEIPKQEKVYTQAEVDARINEAIRKRLKERSEEPVQQQTPHQDFQYDASTGDSWEAQLEAFNESWFQKREQRARQEQYQRHEEQTQAEFEIKFNQGASKYQDFEQVVMGKPLTPQMVIATRGMQDPAAFIYAAAKTQAPELERISRLSDPYAQAVELGRLEQRMRQSRAAVSKAPKPINAVKGDMTEAAAPKTWSIDDKLRQAEKENKAERMRGRSI